MIKPNEYKLSQFNYELTKNTGHLIYNSASSAIIYLDNTEYAKYKICDASNLDFAETMYKQGLWVDKNEDECFRQELYRQTEILKESPKKHIVIAPTLFCNARCYYCYEQGREFSKMTPDIISDTITFLYNYAADGTSLNISWFGGEPLLAVDVIDKITSKLRKLLPASFLLTSTMTSNASLINDGIIHKMVNEWNLKSIQITLDGTQKTYESSKNYIDGKEHFYDVINNIEKLANNNINVEIRLNISNNNCDDLLKLVDYLTVKFKNNKFVDIHAMMLVDYCDIKDARIMDENMITDKALPIFEKLINNGFWRIGIKGSLAPRHLPCSALKKSFFIIGPDGLLYKCQHFLGEQKYNVGSVKYGCSLNSIMKYWCNAIVPEKCNACPLLPICQGGCKQSNNRCVNTKHLIDFLLNKWYDNYIKEDKV